MLYIFLFKAGLLPVDHISISMADNLYRHHLHTDKLSYKNIIVIYWQNIFKLIFDVLIFLFIEVLDSNTIVSAPEKWLVFNRPINKEKHITNFISKNVLKINLIFFWQNYSISRSYWLLCLLVYEAFIFLHNFIFLYSPNSY